MNKNPPINIGNEMSDRNGKKQSRPLNLLSKRNFFRHIIQASKGIKPVGK